MVRLGLAPNVDPTQSLCFSPSASISYEENVGSVTSANSNIPKMQDRSLAVRGDHPATIHHLYPLTF